MDKLLAAIVFGLTAMIAQLVGLLAGIGTLIFWKPMTKEGS
ncbi:MAG: hypothetical protein WA001_01095 [Patescibacteria group bacterium]